MPAPRADVERGNGGGGQQVAGPAAQAVWAVRNVVRSMHGVGTICVEHVGPWADGWGWMRRAEWVTGHRRWAAARSSGPDRDRVREGVDETVRLALEEVAGGEGR